MALYKINNQTVEKIQSKKLDLEKHLQMLFENNLDELLNIKFLAHEYVTNFGGRIDTLGIDKNGSPCILEFKKNQNDNIINQGLSYLRWLLGHKADFEILLKNKLGSNNSVEVDWDSPRIICIAESFNRFDLDTADILPINIELYKFRLFENNMLILEADEYQKGESTSVKIKKSASSKEDIVQKSYTIEDHLTHSSDFSKKLFYTLREKILSIDEEIKEIPKKLYIAYKLATNFVDIEIRSKELKVYLNVKSGQLNDPNNIARDLATPKVVGHWGNGDYVVIINSEADISTLYNLILQSYELNK